jgi:MFS family permease
MSIGPVISALSGVPAGRIVDRLGAPVVVIAGLAAMAAGSVGLAVLPGLFGLAGYIAAIAVLTPGYQLFQAANNTAVMADAGADRRGVVSGLLSLSRNLGLITGASAMGALFAAAAAATDFGTANPEAVASGLRITFAVAAALVAIALILASASRGRVARVSVKSHSIQ